MTSETFTPPVLAPKEAHRLKILFVMLHPGYVRNYESTLRLLLERGHRIHIAFIQPHKQAGDRVAERLAAESGRLTFGRAVKPEKSGWRNIAWCTRTLADFCRYMHPRFAEARKLRARVVDKIRRTRFQLGPLLAIWITLFYATVGRLSGAWVSDRLVRLFMGLEEAIPESTAIERYLRDFRPDLLLVTPLVTVGSHMPDFLKGAHRLGIPTGLCVASWDNLTNKGLVKGAPDRVFLWNGIQRNEAIQMHGIADDAVVVTGAQRFDEWFDQRPTWSRDQFCEMVGIDPAHPFILYVGSSPFIAPHEVDFVKRLANEIRACEETGTRRPGLLVRPHPQNADQWLDADLSDIENVAVWPRRGAQPVDQLSRAGFFDSIHHSAAVLGINTSAQIEAGIVGRSVLTLLAPEFTDTQQGTLHFHYLLHENGGLLHVAPTVEDLCEIIDRAVHGTLQDREQIDSFVRSFVRPFGLDVHCTPVLAASIEELADLEVEPSLTPGWAKVVRFLLRPLAFVSRPLSETALRRVLTRPLHWLARVALGPPPSPKRRSEPRDKVEARAAKQPLKRLERDRDLSRIVLGPWLGTVETELLYWIPFLRWATQRYYLDRSRLIAVSRGGAGVWYRDICADSVDALDLVDFSLYRRYLQDGAGSPGGRTGMDTFEKFVLEAVRRSSGEAAVLPPSTMRILFRRYWKGESPMRHVLAHLDFERIVPPAHADLEERLPDDYVAVQLGFAPWFPDIPENRALANRLVADVAEHSNVVLLGASIDGGVPAAFSQASSSRVVRLLEDIEPARSLHAQSVAIGRAQGFIGTYGGLCSVAAAYGQNVLALYSHGRGLKAPHVDMVERMASATGAQFVLVDARHLDALRWSVGAARHASSPTASQMVQGRGL